MKNIRNFIFEDRESKAQSKVRHKLAEFGKEGDYPTLVRELYNVRLPFYDVERQKGTYMYGVGVARLWCLGLDDEDKESLNIMLEFFANNQDDTRVKALDADLNGQSVDALKSKFNELFKKSSFAYKGPGKTPNGYTIVRIPSYDVAADYREYVTWCVTQAQSAYDNYTSRGRGLFYFCLKDGFENVPAKAEQDKPLDRYGLSMIAVSVTSTGKPNTITCRWNHSHGGDDSVMDQSELCEVLGLKVDDFYKTFPPYTEEEIENKDMVEIVDKIKVLKKTHPYWKYGLVNLAYEGGEYYYCVVDIEKEKKVRYNGKQIYGTISSIEATEEISMWKVNTTHGDIYVSTTGIVSDDFSQIGDAIANVRLESAMISTGLPARFLKVVPFKVGNVVQFYNVETKKLLEIDDVERNRYSIAATGTDYCIWKADRMINGSSRDVVYISNLGEIVDAETAEYQQIVSKAMEAKAKNPKAKLTWVQISEGVCRIVKIDDYSVIKHNGKPMTFDSVYTGTDKRSDIMVGYIGSKEHYYRISTGENIINATASEKETSAGKTTFYLDADIRKIYKVNKSTFEILWETEYPENWNVPPGRAMIESTYRLLGDAPASVRKFFFVTWSENRKTSFFPFSRETGDIPMDQPVDKFDSWGGYCTSKNYCAFEYGGDTVGIFTNSFDPVEKLDLQTLYTWYALKQETRAAEHEDIFVFKYKDSKNGSLRRAIMVYDAANRKVLANLEARDIEYDKKSKSFKVWDADDNVTVLNKDFQNEQEELGKMESNPYTKTIQKFINAKGITLIEPTTNQVIYDECIRAYIYSWNTIVERKDGTWTMFSTDHPLDKSKEIEFDRLGEEGKDMPAQSGFYTLTKANNNRGYYYNPNCYALIKDDKVGYISGKGILVLPFEYDYVDYVTRGNDYGETEYAVGIKGNDVYLRNAERLSKMLVLKNANKMDRIITVNKKPVFSALNNAELKLYIGNTPKEIWSHDFKVSGFGISNCTQTTNWGLWHDIQAKLLKERKDICAIRKSHIGQTTEFFGYLVITDKKVEEEVLFDKPIGPEEFDEKISKHFGVKY